MGNASVKPQQVSLRDIAELAGPNFHFAVRFILYLRNGPDVRANSGSDRMIGVEEHWEFVNRFLLEDRGLWYIVKTGGDYAGYVRIDREGEQEGFSSTRQGIVSIALLKDKRGKGIGSQAIKLASVRAFNKGFKALKAIVQPANIASQRAFEIAGFRYARTDERGYYVLEKRRQGEAAL